MIGLRFAAVTLLALSASTAAQTPPTPPTPPAQPTPPELRARAAERGWGETLRMDAQALHDDIAANHPGVVNDADPAFRRLNDEQLRIALERAATARTYAAHFYALEAYAAAFNDGHLGLGAFGATPFEDTHWPGFLTAYDADGEQRVVTRAEASPLPLGARLVGCDGQSAEQVLEENVGRFMGRWTLRSQRMLWGGTLFMEDGNPYARRPERCTFDVAGQRREVVLDWQPIAHRELILKWRDTLHRPRQAFGARTLADGTRWITLGSFNADPQSDAGRALPPLIAGLSADRNALAHAPATVLDLRANGGGSSDWSRQIAEILWGRRAMNRLHESSVQVDWRVSEANLASLREARDRQSAGGHLSPEMQHWFDVAITGLAEALARGERGLWRHPPDNDSARAAPRGAAPHRLAGPVYIITDAGCASACLDAVDLWRSLGAVHVGQTTSADTLYMDVREVVLPSGFIGVSMPRKVYRGRPRGDNVPVVPVHAFAGDIADTAALEGWIASLPELHRRRH